MNPAAADPATEAPLLAALALSQHLGMLGSARVADVVAHSEAFVAALEGLSGLVVDLGSGGGVPGLVIAWRRRDLRLALVERRRTRADHLRRLTRRLELDDRVAVWPIDANDLPRQLGEPADGVVARGFGSPSVVLDAAVPLLGATGRIVVSEPPGASERWRDALLSRHGLCRRDAPSSVAVLERRSTWNDRCTTGGFHMEPRR